MSAFKKPKTPISSLRICSSLLEPEPFLHQLPRILLLSPSQGPQGWWRGARAQGGRKPAALHLLHPGRVTHAWRGAPPEQAEAGEGIWQLHAALDTTGLLPFCYIPLNSTFCSFRKTFFSLLKVLEQQDLFFLWQQSQQDITA